jgi:hypothetical protein
VTDLAYGTDAGFRLAMARANRVRVRTLGAATSCAALVMAVSGGLAASHQAGGVSRLQPADTPPRPPRAATASPSPAATSPAPFGTGTGTGTGAGAGTGAGPAGVRVSGPATVALPGVAPTARPTAVPRPVPPQSGEFSRTPASGLSWECMPTSGSWCLRALTPKESPRHDWKLQTTLCSSSVIGDSLSYDSAAEMEVRVKDTKGRVLWSWVREHRPPAQPHTLSTQQTTKCFTWAVHWFTRANDGTAIPNGTYRVEFRSLASSVAVPPASLTLTLR